MKFRIGFVSNSSSSSFCIYGIQFESHKEALTRLKKGSPEFIKTFIEKFNDDYCNELEHTVATMDEVFDAIEDLDLYISDFLYEFFTENDDIKVGFYQGSEYNEEMVSFGREWCDIKDKETGEEFKNSTKAYLESYFGKNIKCATHEESFRS
jgi:hypothetical protein